MTRSDGDILTLFEERFRALAGGVHRAASLDEARRALAGILDARAPREAAAAGLPPALAGMARELFAERGIAFAGPPYAPETLPGVLAAADMGLSMARFAIAETGTLAEATDNDAARLVSSLPRAHVCFVAGAAIVRTLGEAASLLREVFGAYGTGCAVSFISGPSRTGDIELKLTLGVHGPESADAILLEYM